MSLWHCVHTHRHSENRPSLALCGRPKRCRFATTVSQFCEITKERKCINENYDWNTARHSPTPRSPSIRWRTQTAAAAPQRQQQQKRRRERAINHHNGDDVLITENQRWERTLTSRVRFHSGLCMHEESEFEFDRFAETRATLCVTAMMLSTKVDARVINLKTCNGRRSWRKKQDRPTILKIVSLILYLTWYLKIPF